MTQQPAIAILGASGRMGQMLAQTVLASDKAKLVAAADRVGSDWIGQDLGVMSGGTANGIIVSDDVKAVFQSGRCCDRFHPAACNGAACKNCGGNWDRIGHWDHGNE